MLQNKYTFNQSSVELEIIGLPDYSNNDNENIISIISGWKLSIINQPEIEGNIEHLKSIIDTFYEFASLLLLEKADKVESNFIDIRRDNEGKYKLLLKSTKTNVKPLEINLGNAEFADIMNCFDQLMNSQYIRLSLNDYSYKLPNRNSNFSDQKKLYDFFIPPLLALFSISVLTLASLNFYETKDTRKKDISFFKNYFYSNSTSLVIEIS